MEFLGAFVNGILSIVAYVIVFLGVYKLYHIAKDIHEIKELMERTLRNSPDLAPARGVVPVVTPELTKGLSAEDSASAYAEHLLRAVSGESQRTENQPHEVR